MNSRDPRPGLEILTRLPAPAAALAGVPPVLFVHGAFAAAWCWEEHFLDHFAQAGLAAHALSLSGHGASRGRDRLDSLSIADYVDDVQEAVQGLDEPPLLVGHSMGGFVVQKYLEKHEIPGAVLMCPVPPQGMMAAAFGLLFSKPGLLRDLNTMLGGGRTSYETLREAMFAQEIALDDLKRFARMSQPESHRAIWDMTLFALPNPARVLSNLAAREASPDSRPLPRGGDGVSQNNVLRHRSGLAMRSQPSGGRGEGRQGVHAPNTAGGVSRLLVIGAEHDHLMPESSARMTARTYGTDAKIFPGMGHGLMLEKDWRIVADYIIGWIKERAA